MNNVIIWMNENKEWLFSGIGITAITLISVGIRRMLSKRKEEQNSQTMIEQINYGTQNTQVGIQNNYYTKEEDNE